MQDDPREFADDDDPGGDLDLSPELEGIAETPKDAIPPDNDDHQAAAIGETEDDDAVS